MGKDRVEIGGVAGVDSSTQIVMDRDVAKAYFEAHKLCPQAVGFDGYDDANRGKLATVSSTAYVNATEITQTVYSDKAPQQPVHLLPGDFVLGSEFRKYTKLFGGPLVEMTPAEIRAMPVRAASKRDAAYFEARGRMKGPIAERAAKVELPVRKAETE